MCRAPAVLLVAALLVTAPAWAQAPQSLLPQVVVPEAEQGPAERLPIEEPAPGFEPVRPVVDEPATVPAEASPTVAPTVLPDPTPVPPPAPPVASRPDPVVAPPPPVPAFPVIDLPAWAVSVVLLLGAFLAGLFGILTATILRKGEMAQRRRSVAATLATELETRLQAFESVPLPPNAEAGVFFVSAVISLAGNDAGFRAAQSDLHLLPGKLASHISVHYAAVQRVADFVKGQSLAAAVRMLQANRMGGYPCPDAGTMRESHVELTAAFRGLDKLVAGLRAAA